MTATDIRAELVQLMRATLADQQLRRTWSYWPVRPMKVPRSWRPGQFVSADCSKGVQFLARWAGAPDPMGNDWGVWGNSQTICLHLRHLVVPSELLPGDVVTFGPGGRSHAAMVLEPGLDPLLWSHGHHGAPNTYRLSQDRREHQLLRLPVPVVIPPDVAILRARRGWFAWAAWRLGEGDWKPYGPMNPAVRPNVRRVISPAWWADWVRYMNARRKPNLVSDRVGGGGDA